MVATLGISIMKAVNIIHETKKSEVEVYRERARSEAVVHRNVAKGGIFQYPIPIVFSNEERRTTKKKKNRIQKISVSDLCRAGVHCCVSL